MFELNSATLSGCWEILPKILKDNRGFFVKTYHHDFFEKNGLETNFREEYYSLSYRGVIRGLHFQLPPHDHTKVVYCIHGKVTDVVVDLRKSSPTYGQFSLFDLNADKGNMVYIPSGLAHGFEVLTESALMMYKVSTVYNPDSDTGILWNSVGMHWQAENPIISDRDQNFQPLSDFRSPFV
ncbi:MAG: dTDP-4-dehydrorhamnose 3,5-epimerase [Cyanobacteriota bacterium]|jgi:dTDP-4-dehydrorhamnose 3,5-epimerase